MERRVLVEAGVIELEAAGRTMRMCMACAVSEHERHDVTVCTDCAICATLRPKPGAKPDELALWQALEQGERPRDAGPRLGIPRNRVVYLCEKWARQRIYEYGVTCDLGWIRR